MVNGEQITAVYWSDIKELEIMAAKTSKKAAPESKNRDTERLATYIR